MIKSYQIETGDVAISDALIGIAAENDCDIYSKLLGEYRPYLVFYTEQKHVGWNLYSVDEHQTVTISEFIALLKKGSQPIIEIGSEVVKFKNNGITVGCQFVDTTTVDAIHKQLHAPKEE